MEMEGRQDEGIEFMSKTVENWKVRFFSCSTCALNFWTQEISDFFVCNVCLFNASPPPPSPLDYGRGFMGGGMMPVKAYRSYFRYLAIFLILFTNMTLSTLLILVVCWTCVINELRNRLRLYGSAVEHRSAESIGLRFDSSLGLRIFFFVPRSWQDEKHLSLFLNYDIVHCK